MGNSEDTAIPIDGNRADLAAHAGTAFRNGEGNRHHRLVQRRSAQINLLRSSYYYDTSGK
jgi:hypothetical protein